LLMKYGFVETPEEIKAFFVKIIHHSRLFGNKQTDSYATSPSFENAIMVSSQATFPIVFRAEYRYHASRNIARAQVINEGPFSGTSAQPVICTS
jgi:hypothetical protein